MRPEGWHLVIIIVLALVLFGAPRLPGIARSVGQSLRIFKSEVRQLKEESDPAEARTEFWDREASSRPVPPEQFPAHETPLRQSSQQAHQ